MKYYLGSIHILTSGIEKLSERTFVTSEQAGLFRRVSGDLVFVSPGDYVCQEEDWLFEWEKENDFCYARRMMSCRGPRKQEDNSQ